MFDRIEAMSDEEFRAELKKHEGSDMHKMLMYAMEAHEPIVCEEEHKCPVCKTEPYTYDSMDTICLYCEGMKPYKKKRRK